MAAGAQVAAEREAVVAGQHQVENDEVDRAVVQRLAHASAVGCGGDAIAVLLQVLGDQLAQVAVVVDDQDVIRPFHRRFE